MKPRIVVTGASGFVGRALSEYLSHSLECSVVGLVRGAVALQPNSSRIQSLDDLREVGAILRTTDSLVHCAAQTQLPFHSKSIDPDTSFMSANRDLTTQLATLAAASGVKRFVFVSSIKVHSDQTFIDRPITENSPTNPTDAYGRSKLAAEQALQILSQNTQMEVVIVRPPLIYGPGVKGNFAKLLKLGASGIPIPMASVVNQRSLVALDNLLSFLALCALRHLSPAAAGQKFVISDGEDVSTPELLRRISAAQGGQVRLFRFPVPLLHLGAFLTGRAEVAERLIGNLQVDSSKARDLLGWRPVITMRQQLENIFR